MIIKTILKKNLSTVNKNQMDLFNKLTNWWHPAGPSQILFAYNYQRIKFLRKHLQSDKAQSKYPLANLKILDVGCGAGFLSESLARLGGRVIGLDPSSNSYNQASTHKSSRADLCGLTYYNMSIEQFLSNYQNTKQKFDIVTSMEVIEHVNNPQVFLDSLSSCTKDGGLIMLSTIRRSVETWLTHVVLAQKIFGVVPKGTHHHEQFINPSECEKMLENSGFENVEKLQLQLNWKGQFVQKSQGGNYLILAKKKAKQQTQKL